MYTSLFLAGLAALADASPISSTGAGGFSVNQVAVGRKLRSGPAALAAAYAKYGVPVPDTLHNAVIDASTGSVVNNPTQYDSEYLCQVGVGQQTLTLDFDTGSADLWVFSTKLPASEQGSGHTLYTCSGTLKSGYTWNISYGDGSGASGIVYADQVTVGGVTATSQAVEAATSVSSEFTQGQGDGLLGLAFSSINTVKPQQQTTFFDTVKAQLAAPLFTATLKHQAPGTYDFGYIDSSKYTGSIAYASVDSSQGFWQFTTGGYAVNNQTSNTGFSAIADTGTSLMLLDDSIVSAYYKQVSGATNSASAGGYVFPCSAKLPSFTVIISGAKLSVPGAYMNYAPQGGSCYGGLQSNSGIGFSILGDVFLKAQYAVFDSTGPRIGFAPQS